MSNIQVGSKVINRLASCTVCDASIWIEWFSDEQALAKVLETILCDPCEEMRR